MKTASLRPEPLFLLCLFAAHAAVAQEDPRLTRSREVAAQFQQELGGTLLGALGSGGPIDAIDICSVEAAPIAAAFSEQTGARVGRTAARLRNPANAPDDDALGVLATFERELGAEANIPPEHFEARTDGSARFMSAIVTQPLCLTCHGTDIAPDLSAAIARHYPSDQATGFETGDLRGAFLIEWPATEVSD